jgi:hyperosmotically inducible protein
MRILFALGLGVMIGAGALWYVITQSASSRPAAPNPAQGTTQAARDTLQDRLGGLNLRPQDIKDELARTGQVVRRKAREAGQVIADATADARVTAAIKARFVTDRDLSALSISVNTTAGLVTLSGSVSAPEHVSKAMLLAIETEGVREVVSTLQVRLRSPKSP